MRRPRSTAPRSGRNCDYVTLPMMWPTIIVTFAFRLVLAFKVFDEVYLLTGGGPGTSTEVLSFTLYQRFFREDKTGYGSAMSIVDHLPDLHPADLRAVGAQARE